jgi:HAE1 family hydrophobic/amphiphilic exporter-1/multidrug efflux pump
VVPLAIATGAGAGARISAGTGVMGGMLAATFLAIFFVPFFFKLITDRRLGESRTAEQLRAEMVEGERRSAEMHAQAVAELVAKSSARGAHE